MHKYTEKTHVEKMGCGQDVKGDDTQRLIRGWASRRGNARGGADELYCLLIGKRIALEVIITGVNTDESDEREGDVKCYVDWIAHAAQDTAAGAGDGFTERQVY